MSKLLDENCTVFATAGMVPSLFSGIVPLEVEVLKPRLGIAERMEMLKCWSKLESSEYRNVVVKGDIG